MAKKYIMVRVEQSTYDRLNAIRQGVLRAYERGQLVGYGRAVELADGLSLSDTIERLVQHVLRDRRRVREARQRAAARRRTERQVV